MKNFLNTIPSLLGKAAFVSLLLGGCTSTNQKEKVTAETAPNELLKQVAQVNTNTDPSETEDLILELLHATEQSSDKGFVFTETISNQTIDTESNTLKAQTQEYASYDVRMWKGKSLYELSELQADGESVNSLSQVSFLNWDEVLFEFVGQEDLWGQPNAKIKVTSVQSEEASAEEKKEAEDFDDVDLSEALSYLSISPLVDWFGDNFTIQPLVTPEQYEFSLTKNGEEYIWTMTLIDPEAYNALYNESYQSTYGVERTDIRKDGSFVLDEYECENALWTITLNEDATFKCLEFTLTEKATKGEENLELISNNVFKVDYPKDSWEDFFQDFFAKVQNKEIKEGSEVTLFDLSSLASSSK